VNGEIIEVLYGQLHLLLVLGTALVALCVLHLAISIVRSMFGKENE